MKLQYILMGAVLGVVWPGMTSAQAGSFTNTGAMTDARSGNTATLLPNGQVLAVGGWRPGNLLASAERYDPATGIWTATDGLYEARSLHTATLLPNGTVMVAGGAGLAITFRRTEFYDPAAGTWSRFIDDMNVDRESHTATLLPNGQVLVAGGGCTGETNYYRASAELYNPATDQWLLTGSMTNDRASHTATLLLDGRVLVAGGGLNDSSAELYDPTDGTWTTTGNMHAQRNEHTATLLQDGKVLVTGGRYVNWQYRSEYLTSAEVFDPSNGVWMVVGSMTEERGGHTATLLPNGQVLVTGGANTNADALASAERYDPATGTWTADGAMRDARYGHTATLLPNGKVLVAGGGLAELYVSHEAPLAATGRVVVTMSPTNAVAAGAQWRLTSGPNTNWQNSGAAVWVSGDVYTIAYRSIAGWQQPNEQPVAVTANNSAYIQGIYVPVQSPFSGATDLGGGWKWLSWFGYFNDSNFPWIYHQQHGWLYTFGATMDSLVFWDNNRATFWWTSQIQYPYLYRFSDNSWLWYLLGSSSPRWMNNLTTGVWEQWYELLPHAFM